MARLQDWRRLSRNSFRSFKSDKRPKTNGAQSNGDIRTETGTSSLNLDNSSSNSSHTTPPPSLPAQSSSHLPYTPRSEGANQFSPPQRPVPITAQSSRSSGVNTSSSSPYKNQVPPSPYAPRVSSISDNSWVNQKVLLINGQIGDLRHPLIDGTVSIWPLQETFPPTTWPVRESRFKALLHLTPGPNKIRLDFSSPKIPNPTAHSTVISVNYLPLLHVPPLQLAILVGKDSNDQFDTVPEKATKEGNGLDVAARKFRMAAYLWQAFTGEQMFRNRFGRRCFRLEEEWQPGTLSCKDAQSNQMRNEAKVHIVRCDKTVEELRALSEGQRDDVSGHRDELFRIATEAMEDYFRPQPGQAQYVSAILLDCPLKPGVLTSTRHTTRKDTGGDIKLALFGSHALYTYPSCIEEVVPAFTDCARADTSLDPSSGNEFGSRWETAATAIGAQLHETGHLFGCPDQESGIMNNDYLRFNRTFTSWEPYCTRTKEQGLRLCLSDDECGWHRLDALRFRFHPCFRQAQDYPIFSNGSVQVWPVENGKILLESTAGVAFVEIFTEGDDICRAYIEYMNADNGNGAVPKQVLLTESTIRSRLGDSHKKAKRLKLVIYSTSLHSHTINDFAQLKSKTSVVKLPNGNLAYRGSVLGSAPQQDSTYQEMILDCACIQTKLLTSIKVYHGSSVDSIEFCYEDFTNQLFGKQAKQSTMSEFVLDTRRGEILTGFFVKGTHQIEGIEVITSQGRKSGVFGSTISGISHALIPPLGYKIAGVSGSKGVAQAGFLRYVSDDTLASPVLKTIGEVEIRF